MSEQQAGAAQETDRRKGAIAILAIALGAIVAIFVLWEAARYIGLFARVSEWQFNTFGQWLPAFTFLVFVFLPMAVIVVVAWLVTRKRQPENPAADSLFNQWHAKAEKFRVVADRVAIAFLLVALVVLAFGFIVMQGGRPAQLVQGGAPAAVTEPAKGGPVRIAGTIDARESATLAFDLLFVKRDVVYVPVTEPGKPREIRYFAELRDNLADPNAATVVYQGKVPGPILMLYRNLGYRIDPAVGLVNASRTTIMWPFFVAAAHLAIGALIAFLIGRFQRRRIRKGLKVKEEYESSQVPLPAA